MIQLDRLRKLDEKVNDDALAEGLRGEHGDARDVQVVLILRRGKHEAQDGHKLAGNEKEGVYEQGSYMQAHRLLIND